MRATVSISRVIRFFRMASIMTARAFLDCFTDAYDESDDPDEPDGPVLFEVELEADALEPDPEQEQAEEDWQALFAHLPRGQA